MTFEIITIIVMACQLAAGGTLETQRLQEECHNWYVDCVYDEAGKFGVETGSKQINAIHMRKCIQRRAKR